MDIVSYEDNLFYYFWKPYGIPSTFGKEKCFLDFLWETKDNNIKNILLYLDDMFGKKQEYGLLNRLDNDTSGLLYFAKTPLIKEKYKKAQLEGKIQKYYIADVYGNFVQNSLQISHPIGHHKFSKDRMVVFLDQKQSGKIDSKRIHHVDTCVEKLYYDKNTNVTTLFIKISKGIRHQIRAHLSSIGNPIVGEKIYIKNPSTENLHLFCVGIGLDSFF